MNHRSLCYNFSLKEEIASLAAHIEKLSDLWPERGFFAAILAVLSASWNLMLSMRNAVSAGYSDLLHADIFLLELLAYLIIADFFVGTLRAVRQGEWTFRMLIGGVSKYPLYAIYVALSAAVAVTIDHLFGHGAVVLDFFVGYLISVEVSSIIIALRRLGFDVPEPLLYLAFGWKQRMKDLIKERIVGKENAARIMNTEESSTAMTTKVETPQEYGEPDDTGKP